LRARMKMALNDGALDRERKHTQPWNKPGAPPCGGGSQGRRPARLKNSLSACPTHQCGPAHWTISAPPGLTKACGCNCIAPRASPNRLTGNLNESKADLCTLERAASADKRPNRPQSMSLGCPEIQIYRLSSVRHCDPIRKVQK
jgi:hypothetical protein